MVSRVASKRRSLFLRWPVWVIYALLFAAAIPWYWPEEAITLVVGIPLWAAVTLGASVVLCGYTAWLLWAGWPAEDELDEESR